METKKKKQNTEPEAVSSQAPKNELAPMKEQMARRQSAPRPTAVSEAQKIYQMQQQKMTTTIFFQMLRMHSQATASMSMYSSKTSSTHSQSVKIPMIRL